MPIPLIGYAAAGAIGLLAQPLFSAYSKGVNAFVDPTLLPVQNVANLMLRTSIPDATGLVSAYINGNLAKSDFINAMGMNNILVYKDPNDNHQRIAKNLWESVVETAVPQLSLEQLHLAYVSGIIDVDLYRALAGRYKMKPGHFPVMDKLIKGKLDQGVIFNEYFRGYTTREEAKDKIRKLYVCNDVQAYDILKTTQYLPPVSDLLRFAVRDVYNDNIVERLQLDSEYDEIDAIIPWARAVGIPEKTKLGGQLGNAERDILRDYWRAHWQLISPTQGYEALHRLRPDRIQRYLDKIPGLQPFTFNELNDLLKMADYLPQQRKVLAATSYRVIGRIDLRRLYESDVIPLQEAYEQLQDQGYNETDAGYLRDWMKLEKDKKKDKEDEKRNKQIYGRLVKQMEAGYKEGSVRRETVINALLSFGYEQDEASSIVNALDIEINRKRVVTFIKMVRSEFMLGLYTGLQAVEELIQGGVTNIRASQYVIQWQRVLDRPRRLAGANTVIDWLKRGIISFDDARNRLSNLGFSNADTMLYLETADQDIRKAITLEEAKRARTEQQQAREAERLQRQMQTDIRTMQSQLRTFSPIAKMIKWVQSGLLDVGTFTQRMTLLAVPPEDQARYIIEATGVSNGQ